MRKIDTCNKTLTAFLPHITFLSYFCVGNKLIPIIHRLMKTTILLGLLLTLTASCKHHSNPVTTEENLHTQEANRLVAEAGNLWSPSLDSTFFFNNDSEHISINDKEIWAKLDSALAIDPTNIKVYVGRISYLSACKKYREILSVLRQAEKQSPLSADLWSMKAMFEDYFGDSLTAQKLSVCRFRLCHPHKRICYRQPQVCQFPH